MADLSQTQEFILEVLKITLPFVVGVHMKQPGYMKHEHDKGQAPFSKDHEES